MGVYMNKETDALGEFQDNLQSQLRKNGFPDKAVAFPLEALFESASRKGFSFNKIRDRLSAAGIETELEETRVVFRAAVPQSGSVARGDTEGGFDAAAADVLANISPEQMKTFRDMVSKVSPSEMAAMKAQLDAMSDSEKAEMMRKMKDMFGRG
jgi:hypothetical protein